MEVLVSHPVGWLHLRIWALLTLSVYLAARGLIRKEAVPGLLATGTLVPVALFLPFGYLVVPTLAAAALLRLLFGERSHSGWRNWLIVGMTAPLLGLGIFVFPMVAVHWPVEFCATATLTLIAAIGSEWSLRKFVSS